VEGQPNGTNRGFSIEFHGMNLEFNFQIRFGMARRGIGDQDRKRSWSDKMGKFELIGSEGVNCNERIGFRDIRTNDEVEDH
jgi:hypothetical protein